MLIYFILLITIFYCFFLSRITIIKHTSGGENEIFVSRSKFVLLIWFIILLVLIAFKGMEVGVDYPMYYGFFVQENYRELLEPGISFLYDLAVKYDNFYVFSVLVYSLFLLFMFYGIKNNTPNYLISILLFVIMHIYFNAFNQIRQLLAVSIVFCFIHFLTSGKKIDKLKYCFILLLALWFHNSAIFLFVLFFVSKKKYSPKC